MSKSPWRVGVDWAAVALAGVFVVLAAFGVLPAIPW
ncbi:hypothetical protein HUW46_07538 [Amycolatopsis sp. CA-230715]|nr:hypothetical protein HUW46_07538 [Amycolatopsis sp. CA-230715]